MQSLFRAEESSSDSDSPSEEEAQELRESKVI